MAPRGLSIKTQIIVTLVLLPLVSLLIVGAIALLQNQDSLSFQAQQNLARMMQEKATGYDYVFTRIQQEVEAAAAYVAAVYAGPVPKEDLGRRLLMPWTGTGYGNAELRKTLHDEILRLQRVGQFLNAIVSKNPYLSLGYVGTETSLTVFDNEPVVDVIEAIKAFDVRQRPWYLRARQVGGPIWTDLYVDANTKKLNVTAAAPVKDATGKLIGVAGLDVLLETLQSDFLNIDIGYKNEPFLINRQGLVIVRRGMDQKNTEWDKTYKTDNLLESPNPGFRRIVQTMVTGKSGIQSFIADDRSRNLVAFAPIAAVNASLGIIVPVSEVVRPVRENGRLVILVLAAFILASIGVGVWLGNRVTRPIQELTVLVDKASKGLLEVDQIPTKRADEVGVLAGAFNRMLSNLSTLLKELEQREKKKP